MQTRYRHQMTQSCASEYAPLIVVDRLTITYCECSNDRARNTVGMLVRNETTEPPSDLIEHSDSHTAVLAEIVRSILDITRGGDALDEQTVLTVSDIPVTITTWRAQTNFQAPSFARAQLGGFSVP